MPRASIREAVASVPFWARTWGFHDLVDVLLALSMI